MADDGMGPRYSIPIDRQVTIFYSARTLRLLAAIGWLAKAVEASAESASSAIKGALNMTTNEDSNDERKA